MSKTIKICSFMILALCSQQVLIAETIYKSVDESGQITYSATPSEDPVSTQPMELSPGPTDEDIDTARARFEATRQLALEMEQIRKQKDEERRKAAEEAAARDIPPAPIVIQQPPAYYPTYPYYRRPYRRWQPRHRPVPYNAPEGYEEHPIYRPGNRIYHPGSRPSPKPRHRHSPSSTPPRRPHR